MDDKVELKKVIQMRHVLVEYQDTLYLKFMRQLNTEKEKILKGNLGNELVQNIGRDIAGEVVRSFFDTSNYNITVDQLARRILHFSYEEEFDPLAANGGVGEITKTVYNYNDMNSSELDQISEIMEKSQEKLFTEDRRQDKLDIKGKKAYRESRTDVNGDIYDELTGEKGQKTTYTRNGKTVIQSELQADHVQAREAATYNSHYMTEAGIQDLKSFINSADNMQMIQQSANASKGDIRVCNVGGKIQYINARSAEYDAATDITYKATPEQLADAYCSQWEKEDASKEQQNQPKIQKLKEKGYLNEDGKVPKSVKKELIEHIKHSQNTESKKILKGTKYKTVSSDAYKQTKGAMGKIVAGQIIYYTAPPLVYEVRTILSDKTLELGNVLEKLEMSVKRIGNYVVSKLNKIFSNIAVNTLKRFIKSFMDILINMVKATVKKLLKLGKNLILSTVDAVRIIADRNTSNAQKADAVFQLYGVTITSCVIEILFEMAGDALHIPEPFDDIIFGPVQILTTVVCTNLTMLMLKKLDLFDVQYGFKMSQIRKLFEETNNEYKEQYNIAAQYTDDETKLMLDKAKQQCREIYENLQELDYNKESARGELEKINNLFSMNIDFEKDWLRFLGVSV